MADKFHPVHVRHFQITDDDIDRGGEVTEQFKRDAAVGGFEDVFRAQRFERDDQRFTLKFVILGDKKVQIGDVHGRLSNIHSVCDGGQASPVSARKYALRRVCSFSKSVTKPFTAT